MALDPCQPTQPISVDHWWSRAQRRLLRSLWPSHCLLCGERCGEQNFGMCIACEQELPRNLPACRVCSEPLEGERVDLVCGRCVRDPPSFDACFAPFRYAYPLDHLVRRFKYTGELANGRVLAEAFAAAAGAHRSNDLPQVLLPVPLGRARFRRRGFNQAIELSTRIGATLELPVDSTALVRTRETAEQAGLDQRERRRNLRGAFALQCALHASFVAVVDDVVTTGSTANEVARVLKESGVARVEIWAIARAGRSVG